MQPLPNRALPSSAFFKECELVYLEPFHGHIILGGCFGRRAPAWSEVAGAAIPAELCWALQVMPFSPESAINRQKSTGKTSHDKISPSQQMEAAVMPDLARCCIMYVRREVCPARVSDFCDGIQYKSTREHSVVVQVKLSGYALTDLKWFVQGCYTSYSFLAAAAWRALFSCFPWAALSRS